MIGFLLRGVIAALGLWIATRWVHGLHIDDATTLLLGGLLLGLVNAVVRPIAIILTFPITLVTLGLFLLVINAAVLELVAALVRGFTVSGFGTALVASIFISITSVVFGALLGADRRRS